MATLLGAKGLTGKPRSIMLRAMAHAPQHAVNICGIIIIS
jgi:hypothetical protein